MCKWPPARELTEQETAADKEFKILTRPTNASRDGKSVTSTVNCYSLTVDPALKVIHKYLWTWTGP